jgi:hypothetical protein
MRLIVCDPEPVDSGWDAPLTVYEYRTELAKVSGCRLDPFESVEAWRHVWIPGRLYYAKHGLEPLWRYGLTLADGDESCREFEFFLAHRSDSFCLQGDQVVDLDDGSLAETR